jgi:hypothetical protein
VAGLLVIAYATLRPGGPRFKLAPGWTCLLCGSSGGVDVALNIILFIPLGVGLRLRGASIRRAAATAFLVSLFVEGWQNFVVSGRDPTISDVLTNTTGGTLGATMTAFAGAWRLGHAGGHPDRYGGGIATVDRAATLLCPDRTASRESWTLLRSSTLDGSEWPSGSA